MSLFTKKQDWIQVTSSNNVLGGTARFDLTREYPIDAIMLVVSVTVSTGAATLNADGLLKLLRRVQINGPDGASNRNVVDIDGASLVELGLHYNGFTDRNTRTRINTASITTTTYEIVYPIYFCLPQIDSPLREAMLLPVDRYNANPQINIQWCSQAEMDTNASPTFAVSALSVTALVIRRIIDRKQWPILATELFSLQQTYASTGDNQQFEVPINGNYTGILLRTQTSASARGDISPAGSDWDYRLSGNVFRRFRLLDVQRENDFSYAVGSTGIDVLSGSYFLDFITDGVGSSGNDPTVALGSLLNANIPLNSGARIFIRQNITGGAAVGVTYAFHRIYGNLAAFKK